MARIKHNTTADSTPAHIGDAEPVCVRGVVNGQDESRRRLSVLLEPPSREWDEEGLLRLALYRRQVRARLDPEASAV